MEIDYSSMGPKMRELGAKQRAWVYAYVECGGDATAAAKAAGYGEKSDTEAGRLSAAQTAGWRNLRDEKVLEAMKEEAMKRLRSGALLAAERMVSFMNDPNLSSRDAVKVTAELLDRAGLVVQQKVEITTKTEKEETLVRDIQRLSAQLGIDPTRLLGHSVGQVVDAEFTEVTDAPKLEDLF